MFISNISSLFVVVVYGLRYCADFHRGPSSRYFIVIIEVIIQVKAAQEFIFKH